HHTEVGRLKWTCHASERQSLRPRSRTRWSSRHRGRSAREAQPKDEKAAAAFGLGRLLPGPRHRRVARASPPIAPATSGNRVVPSFRVSRLTMFGSEVTLNVSSPAGAARNQAISWALPFGPSPARLSHRPTF